MPERGRAWQRRVRRWIACLFSLCVCCKSTDNFVCKSHAEKRLAIRRLRGGCLDAGLAAGDRKAGEVQRGGRGGESGLRRRASGEDVGRICGGFGREIVEEVFGEVAVLDEGAGCGAGPFG